MRMHDERARHRNSSPLPKNEQGMRGRWQFTDNRLKTVHQRKLQEAMTLPRNRLEGNSMTPAYHSAIQRKPDRQLPTIDKSKDAFFGFGGLRDISMRNNGGGMTIDALNASAGIYFDRKTAVDGLYYVRKALDQPASWLENTRHVTGYRGNVAFTVNPQTTEEKWISFLVNHKQEINLRNFHHAISNQDFRESFTKSLYDSHLRLNRPLGSQVDDPKQEIQNTLRDIDTNNRPDNRIVPMFIREWIFLTYIKRVCRLGLRFVTNEVNDGGLGGRAFFNIAGYTDKRQRKKRRSMVWWLAQFSRLNERNDFLHNIKKIFYRGEMLITVDEYLYAMELIKQKGKTWGREKIKFYNEMKLDNPNREFSEEEESEIDG